MPIFKGLVLVTYSVILDYLYSAAYGLYDRIISCIYAPSKRQSKILSPAPLLQEPRFPPELLELIAELLFQLQPQNGSTSGEETLVCCTKPSWGDVRGFMAASPALHHMGMMRWLQVLTIQEPGDWALAVRYSSVVREIRCLSGVLTSGSDKLILASFLRLHTLSIDTHDDVIQSGNRWMYRKPISFLPSSIVRLEITHAHSPDVNFISAVKRHCPALEELRLGRCTMFNRSSACDFWRSFPLEHSSYISDGGIEEYASSLAQELAPLRNLKVLRMGIYLASSSAVLGHRLYHTRGRLAPDAIDWQLAIPLAQQLLDDDAGENPVHVEPANTEVLINLLHQSDSEFDDNTCSLCATQYRQANQDAEANANNILIGLVPSLETIQWMNWFTPKHLGVSSYHFVH
ncbi:hypothetical protein FRC12_018677 [Ceratobasidium sp. 428]|nr:hypothetical protein FRC12_018677 [Ceratobasidium sp. 428]